MQTIDPFAQEALAISLASDAERTAVYQSLLQTHVLKGTGTMVAALANAGGLAMAAHFAVAVFRDVARMKVGEGAPHADVLLETRAQANIVWPVLEAEMLPALTGLDGTATADLAKRVTRVLGPSVAMLAARDVLHALAAYGALEGNTDFAALREAERMKAGGDRLPALAVVAAKAMGIIPSTQEPEGGEATPVEQGAAA